MRSLSVFLIDSFLSDNQEKREAIDLGYWVLPLPWWGSNMSSEFDRLASAYPFLEHFLFGSKLQEMRCVYLPQLADCQDILLIGEGTGLFLEKLLMVNPKAKVTVIDQSAK